MKKLKAREEHKCSYCNKPAVWTANGKHACENHKPLLKEVNVKPKTATR